MTQRQIAHKFGFSSHASINKIFKVNGWKARPAKQRRQEANPEEVRRLYFDEGLSQREVAEKLGLRSPSPVQRIFKERGWKTRGRWGNGPVYGRSLFNTEKERALGNEKRAKKQQQDLKEMREHLFGTECKICGTSNEERTIAIHRKDFTEHKQNKLWLKGELESVDTEKWVALCVACHRGVHWLKERHNADWSDIEQYLKRKNHMIPQIREPFSLSEKDKPSQKYEEIAEETREKIKELRKLLFGEKCSLCGDSKNRRLVIHRKDGRPHRHRLLWSEGNLKYLNPDEWAVLCQKCHRYVHWAEASLGLEWGDLDSDYTGNV